MWRRIGFEDRRPSLSQGGVIQLQKMCYLASYVVGIPTDIYRFFAARRGTWLFQG
jgi:hypothetical protein